LEFGFHDDDGHLTKRVQNDVAADEGARGDHCLLAEIACGLHVIDRWGGRNLRGVLRRLGVLDELRVGLDGKSFEHNFSFQQGLIIAVVVSAKGKPKPFVGA